MSQRRPITLLVALSALAMAAFGPSAAHAATTSKTYAYVGATGVWIGVGPGGGRHALLGRELAANPHVGTAQWGYFTFDTTAPSFAVTIDDLGSEAGQRVPVLMHITRPDGSYRAQYSCLPVGTAISRSAPVGSTVLVLLAGEGYWAGMPRYDLHCEGGALAGGAATAGTVEVVM